jgi:rod shape-determining protein MreC
MPPYDVDSGERRNRRDRSAVWGLLALSLVLILLPLPAQQAVSTALRSTVLGPFLWVQESVSRTRVWTFDIATLQARHDSLAALLHAQALMSLENQRLRELLELRARTGPTFVSASAIRPGTRGAEGLFLLDVGTRDGVAVHDPVVTSDGLVGVIREVAPGTALMMDLSHPDFRVSVMTLDGGATGVIEPRKGALGEGDRLLLNGIPYHTTLEAGTALVTSGQGAVFPRGIRVGTVRSLAEAEAGWRRGYWVEPFAPLNAVVHVLVITGAEGAPTSDLTSLWLPEGVSLPDPAIPESDAAIPESERESQSGVPQPPEVPAPSGVPRPSEGSAPSGESRGSGEEELL